eukprot:CAMPEP_0119104296 /NCGR_PEP_ID=MMETSP1180-20130426/2538_1 /TAXON_ID=3052 ORGANISM="Chlamydomonas cf sp, Strain CCMP681" /NCGR_SAMPLE_ID=MMETSP1180 /ASSEMBLY_ACC=CAM_ASM_000741 /LENGTH=45 /DNA_ID= /DNA_START= /DNA_END= /DNA_ORIENTATION=
MAPTSCAEVPVDADAPVVVGNLFDRAVTICQYQLHPCNLAPCELP